MVLYVCVACVNLVVVVVVVVVAVVVHLFTGRVGFSKPITSNVQTCAGQVCTCCCAFKCSVLQFYATLYDHFTVGFRISSSMLMTWSLFLKEYWKHER